MEKNDEQSLELLRQIFLAENNYRQDEFENELTKLKYQITDKNAKIEAYYPIITDLLERKIIDSEDELAKVLSPLMGKAIKKQVTESKDDIIDALYPIMGDTIKRSVSEGIKEIYNSINLKIENALRRGIFSKQIKSKLTGVSASDLILQESFPFRISEIFLIHESSGLLLSHMSSSQEELSSDGDLISGMLTAIKDFVSESFKKNGGSQNLYEIQYGDSKIVLERGLYSYLAVVISGQEPNDFHKDLNELNTDIYSDYQKTLREYDGQSFEKSGLEKLLADFIDKYKFESEINENKKSNPILLYLLLTLFVIFLIILSVIKLPQYFEDKSTEKEIQSKLEQFNDLGTNEIEWFCSDGEVQISGLINSYKMKKQIDSLIIEIPTVKKLDNKLLVAIKTFPRDSIINRIEHKLSRFDTSYLTYQLNDDKIILEGRVETVDVKREIGYLVSSIPGIRVVINDIVINTHGLSIYDIQDLVNKSILSFNYLDTDLNKENKSKLDRIINLLSWYKKSHLIITACSVGDNNAANLAKADERSKNVANYITSKGISPDQFELKHTILEDSNGENNKNERFVKFEFFIRD